MQKAIHWRNRKTHPNQSRGILISLTILKSTCLFAAFPYIRVPQTAANIWSKDSFLKSAPLIPTASTNVFHLINLFLFSRDQVPTNSVAPSSVYKAYTTHNSSICSGEGLTLETSAFQSLYGGQFTLSTPLINQIFVFHSPTDAAPQFLQKLTPFTLSVDPAADRARDLPLSRPALYQLS